MIDPGDLLGFAIAAALIIAIPGPSVLFVIGRALTLGRAGALMSVAGNATGTFVQVLAVAAGLGAIIERSALVFAVVKYAGAAYLVYLGIQAIRHRKQAPAQARGTVSGAATILRDSFIVGVTNPKTIVFFIAVLPHFVDASSGTVPLQMVVLGAVFLGISLVLDSVWALSAGAARDWFARSPERVAGLRATGGVAMIGLGGAVALTSTEG